MLNPPLISLLHQLILTLIGRLILKILSSRKTVDRNSRAYVINLMTSSLKAQRTLAKHHSSKWILTQAIACRYVSAPIHQSQMQGSYAKHLQNKSS